jgi:hypothetical protein
MDYRYNPAGGAMGTGRGIRAGEYRPNPAGTLKTSEVPLTGDQV